MPISLHLVEKTEPSRKGPRRPSPKEKEKDAFSEEVPAESIPPACLGRNRRILVVDDNPVVLKAFELKLKSDGFVVTTIANSAAVASAAEQAQAELIILDINFPAGSAMEWNGFTAMQWLRRFPELTKIPVILISGNDAAEYKAKALAAGAAGFFQKPVVYKDILTAIFKALGEPATK